MPRESTSEFILPQTKKLHFLKTFINVFILKELQEDLQPVCTMTTFVHSVLMEVYFVHREINSPPLVASYTGSEQGLDQALMLGLKILEVSLFALGP